MNWDDLRFVLAVARHGSHSAAARALGVTQPTVGRRLRALEQALGDPLFERSNGVLAPTPVAASVLEQVEEMEARALAAERIARRGRGGCAGEVHVSASDWLASRVLPGALATIAARAPEVQIALAADPRVVSLPRNEADIALRPRRFEYNGVWQRAVGSVPFAVYGSRAYLARRDPPSAATQCDGHELILMDDSAGPIADVEWLGRVAARARVRARVNGRDAMASLALSGLGLACLPTLVGDATRGLTRVASLDGAPGRTLWLGMHRDRRALARVRLAASVIRDAVAKSLPR